MGFWVLVPGVGMGGSGAAVAQATGRWEYAAGYAPWEYAVPASVEHAVDASVEYAVEAP